MKCFVALSFLLSAGILLAANPAFAQSVDANPFVYDENDNPANWCRNGQFPGISADYRTGRVKMKTRLINDDDGKNADACPSADTTQCPANEFIKARTSVVISKKLRDFYCVYNPASGSSGWVSAKALDIAAIKKIKNADWVGKWSDGENRIEIKKDKSGLHVVGNAQWLGATLEDGNQVAHAGELSAATQPKSDRLVLNSKEDDCSAELINLGRYLVVRDNGSCGGVNVRFNGVYKRK